MQVLLDLGISTRRGVMNSHLEPAYGGRGMYRASGSLARSELAQHTSIMLPLFAHMSEDDVGYVASELGQALVRVPEEAL